MLYIFLADGFEETEAVAPADVIKRAGLEVKFVGVDGELVCGAHNITVKTDCSEPDYSDISGVILPGGMPGTLNFRRIKWLRRN